MTDQKIELEMFFKKMLGDIDELIKVDKSLQKDWEKKNMSFQWYVDEIMGYQIFENGKYTHKFGEEIENADLTLELTDSEIALKFLKGDLENYTHVLYKRKFKLYTYRLEEVKKETGTSVIRHFICLLTARFGRGKSYHPYILHNLPIFRKIVLPRFDPATQNGSYIPINESLGTYENQLLPEKLIGYFINKTKRAYVLNVCGCRVYHDCQDHDRSYGCMYLGDDLTNLKLPPERGRFITQKEAIKHVKGAIKNGLIPVFGRSPIESFGLNVEDTGHLMSMCFCCPCCCINANLTQYSTTTLHHLFIKMEGLTVEVAQDECLGCETCMDVCIFDGIEVIDGVASVNPKKCVGCGRCETICPNDAITIRLDDPKRLDELIHRIEESVDVS